MFNYRLRGERFTPLDYLRALSYTFQDQKVTGAIRKMCQYLHVFTGIPKKPRRPPQMTVPRGVDKWVNRKHKSRANGLKRFLDGILKD